MLLILEKHSSRKEVKRVSAYLYLGVIFLKSILNFQKMTVSKTAKEGRSLKI